MKIKASKYFLSAAVVLCTVSNANAEERPLNGRFKAQVKTENGTFEVPVDIRDGEVSTVRWPDGEKMKLRNAEVNKGAATGQNFYGDRYTVTVEEPAKDYEIKEFSVDELRE